MLNSQPRSRRSRRALALSATALVLGGYASAGAAEGPYPGLPRPSQNGGWAGAVQTGIAEASKARQWAHVPMQAAAAFSYQISFRIPPDDPRETSNERTNLIYLVAPDGSEHNYGVSPVFSVRTVAFGAVPVKVTAQLIQRRENGLPVPIVSSNRQNVYKVIPPGRPSKVEETDTFISDKITLRVNSLVVDGVDLGLTDRCQTVEPGDLTLFGKGAYSGEPGFDSRYPWRTGHYLVATGGLLTGTVDVPAFANCLTSRGEDVSRLLTATVSGPGNEVKLHASAPACQRPVPPMTTGPPPPGATTPEAAGCTPDRIPPEIPIP